MAFIEAKKAERFYGAGATLVKAVNGMTFSIREGSLAIILGPSGAGKTTLLNLLGGMDSLTGGDIVVDGVSLYGKSRAALTDYRRKDVGFVFQFYNLMSNLTALENVELSTEISEHPLDPKATLESVGLGERLNNFPGELSGGEQQRVSIARALAKNPKILLCDEPTGALDYKTGKLILSLLQELSRKERRSVIIVTHNAAIAPIADTLIRVKNGEIEEFSENPSPAPIEEVEW